MLCLNAFGRRRSFTRVRRECVTHCLAPANAREHAYHQGRGDATLDVIFYSGSPLVAHCDRYMLSTISNATLTIAITVRR